MVVAASRKAIFERVYDASMAVYTEIDGYEERDARLTAEVAANGWYDGGRLFGKGRRRTYRGLAKMPDPGSLLVLGAFLELDYVDVDGRIHSMTYDKSDGVPLLWSRKLQACFVLPTAKQGPCNLPPRRAENELAKVWAKGRPARCSAKLRYPKPPLRSVFPAIAVGYSSDKFSHGVDKPYIHHIESRVLCYFSSDPRGASRAPKAIMIRGGNLRLTPHGLAG